MRRLLPAAILAAAAAAATPADALPLISATGVTLGVTGGTLGVGPEVTYRVNPLLGLRASATFLGFDANGNISDYRYEGRLKIRNFGGSIDLHPLAGGLRLSAGLRATSGNKARFRGMARTNQTYGGVTFTPEQAGSLSGTIRTKDVAPLLTAGYAHTGLTGFMFGLDAGVMFHGQPRVTDLVATGQLGSNALAQAERARQEQRLRNRVDDYRYYPVVQLSLGYRF